jgi:hypothetical protein
MKQVLPNQPATSLAASHQHRGRGRALTLCLLLFVVPPLLAESTYLAPGHPDGVALLADA